MKEHKRKEKGKIPLPLPKMELSTTKISKVKQEAFDEQTNSLLSYHGEVDFINDTKSDAATKMNCSESSRRQNFNNYK